ncbi:MAG: FtsX-like permease family protein [Thermomicrobiales bacterium]
MKTIFGVPMTTITIVLVVLLAICLLSVLLIAIRRPVIFKLGIRNIPRRKTQTALIVVGLMLATLIITAALGTGDTLNRSIDDDALRTLGPLDEVVVFSNANDGTGEATSALTRTIPDSSIQLVEQTLAGNDVVRAIGGVLYSQAPVLNLGTNDPAGASSVEDVMSKAVQSEPNVTIAGLDQATLDAVGGLETVDGQKVDLTTLGADGIYLGQKGADKLNAQVGDYVVFSLNNQFHSGVVKGIVPSEALTGSIEPGMPSILMDLARLQQLTGNEGKVSGVGIANTGNQRSSAAHTDTVVNALKPVLKDQGLGVVPIKQDNLDGAEFAASVFVTFFLVFGLFSIGVGILLIVLIFTMLAAERRSEMGMQRAIGAQRGALVQQFIAEGTGYSLLAGIVGVVLGVAATWAIAWGIGAAIGGDISINPYVSPKSMIAAYALGVTITFLAIVVSSSRVSRLNVVAAIRDIPDAYHAKRNRKQLAWGIAMIVVGIVALAAGKGDSNAFLFMAGLTLVPFGIATISTYFGAPTRLVMSIASIIVLVLWLMPDSMFSDIFGEFDGGIEMFFVSGICIVAASTILILQNLDAILSIAEHIGSRIRGQIAAIRLAVSYPAAAKSRTGMTIAMFSLIVFSLVMIAAINANFDQAFFGTDANAGWQVRVDVPQTNPISNFDDTLRSSGVDTAQIAGEGSLTMPNAGANRVRAKDTDDWSQYTVNVMDEGFLSNATMKFSGRAEGYDSDAAIIEALRTDPNVGVIDSFAIQDSSGFGQAPTLSIDGIVASGTFAAPTISVDSGEGQPKQVRIIGVIDSKISSLYGLFVGPGSKAQLFPSLGSAPTSYFLKLAPGANTKQVSDDVERALIAHGAQAVDIAQESRDAQAQQRSFLYILEGFMGLGLIVGIAAVGVVAFRAIVERRQQIGMVRAIGFQRSTVSLAFVFESAVIVILGVLAGAVFGLILARNVIASSFFVDGGSGISFVVPWGTVLVTIGAAIIAALLMSWLPARQAASVSPAEALRYE